jgi:cation diffusion facilitator family transporter
MCKETSRRHADDEEVEPVAGRTGVGHGTGLLGRGDVMARRSSKRVVYAALLGNVLVALTKFAAAGLSGSSAMVSEAIHSLVDTGNEILLLYGMRRAARPPDELHPLGHGRELYFWSFIVTLLIFGLGAGVSVYEGISHVIAPVPISNAIVNYVVLGLAFVFEGMSWGVAMKEFRSAKGKRGYFEAVRQSKDPTMFMVLFEDSAALIGLMIALVGIVASETLDRPVLDGVASIGIGILLGVVAMFLAREAKGLLIGEPAALEVVSSICTIARAHPGVERSTGLFTVHLGPDQIVAAIGVDFVDTLSAGEVETIVATIEKRVRNVHPEVVLLLIKPQSAAALARFRPSVNG